MEMSWRTGLALYQGTALVGRKGMKENWASAPTHGFGFVEVVLTQTGHYSHLSATMGSTRAARRAGRKQLPTRLDPGASIRPKKLPDP